MNVFIIIFDQFKASLLNKSINFYNFFPKKQKNYTDSKLLNGTDKRWSLDLSIHQRIQK